MVKENIVKPTKERATDIHTALDTLKHKTLEQWTLFFWCYFAVFVFVLTQIFSTVYNLIIDLICSLLLIKKQAINCETVGAQVKT